MDGKAQFIHIRNNLNVGQDQRNQSCKEETAMDEEKPRQSTFFCN